MNNFSKLATFVVLVALLFSGLNAVKANGQETCPSAAPWVKVDGLTGTSFTYTAPDGYSITEWCYKASTSVVYGSASGSSVTVTSTVTNKNGQVQDLSHASFKLEQDPVETPTEEPTSEPTQNPTEDPTEAPTEVPTEEPTSEPTEEPTPPTRVPPTQTKPPQGKPGADVCEFTNLDRFNGQTWKAIFRPDGWEYLSEVTKLVKEGKISFIFQPRGAILGTYDVFIGGQLVFKAILSRNPDGRINCGWSAPAQPVPATGSEELPDEGSGYEVYIFVIATLAFSSLLGAALIKRR